MSINDKKKTASKKVSSKLGHDPLAWIDESEGKDELPGEELSGSTNRNQPSGKDESISVIAERLAADEESKSAHAGRGSSAGSYTLTLPAYFGIAQSSGICSEMRDLFNRGYQSVRIAGGDVESFDTAAVQLMMAFSNYAHSTGVEVEWSGCSEKIREVKEFLGVNF